MVLGGACKTMKHGVQPAALCAGGGQGLGWQCFCAQSSGRELPEMVPSREITPDSAEATAQSKLLRRVQLYRFGAADLSLGLEQDK